MEIKRWRIIFVTLAGFYVVCNIAYNVFGSSDRQDWDRCDKKIFGYINDVSGLEMEELNQTKTIKKVVEEDTVV
ncbi:unnamed protein product, partial [Brenthis ino]